MSFHGYCGIESLDLTAAQRQTLVSELRALGVNDSAQPSRRNHWRVRLDNLAVIFHAEFGDTDLSQVSIRNRLAAIFEVNNTSITYATQQTTFANRQSPVVTFSYSGTPRLRMTAFGGLGATWMQSLVEVTAYLAAHRADWETGEV